MKNVETQYFASFLLRLNWVLKCFALLVFSHRAVPSADRLKPFRLTFEVDVIYFSNDPESVELASVGKRPS
ncbi:MAG: hypothetical protein ABJA76_00410 [Mucilaginibacter sp.]